ncbi:hypothetical protein Taro_027275 [Colocasia esculenta]|uniref:Uncharacterized protein n=1 Tax=Colocasia esculenta TaxID=4460 RepID=A0A843VDI4_COLES|nr:hypothetical protein [Colocasia esculenta]
MKRPCCCVSLSLCSLVRSRSKEGRRWEMVESLWTPITYIFGLIRCPVGVQIGGHQFQVGGHRCGHILSTSCASMSERSCDLERYRRQHRWPPTTGWRQSPWTLTQVGVHLPGRLHEVGGLIPGRQQGLPGLRNYPEIPAHLHHSLGHATHVAVPNGHMGHLGTPLTQNIVNVTVELSSFGRPKKEKLEPHLRPLLNLVNQVNQQSIIANERPVTFASTRRTSTVDNGDPAGGETDRPQESTKSTGESTRSTGDPIIANERSAASASSRKIQLSAEDGAETSVHSSLLEITVGPLLPLWSVYAQVDGKRSCRLPRTAFTSQHNTST